MTDPSRTLEWHLGYVPDDAAVIPGFVESVPASGAVSLRDASPMYDLSGIWQPTDLSAVGGPYHDHFGMVQQPSKDAADFPSSDPRSVQQGQGGAMDAFPLQYNYWGGSASTTPLGDLHYNHPLSAVDAFMNPPTQSHGSLALQSLATPVSSHEASQSFTQFPGYINQVFRPGHENTQRRRYAGQDMPKKCKCSTCGQLFKSRGDLLRHINSENGSARYACSACWMKFFSPDDLRWHVHNGAQDCNAPAMTGRHQ